MEKWVILIAEFNVIFVVKFFCITIVVCEGGNQ